FFNVVEFGLDPQSAVERPRFYSANFPSSAYPPIYVPGGLRAEADIGDDVIQALVRRGHVVEVLPARWEGACLYGLILRNPQTGMIEAGADPRGGTAAMAY